MKKVLILIVSFVTLMFQITFANINQPSDRFDQFYIDNKVDVTHFIETTRGINNSVMDSTTNDGLVNFFSFIHSVSEIPAVEAEFERFGGFLEKYDVKVINDEYYRIFGVKIDLTKHLMLVSETHNWEETPFAFDKDFIYITSGAAGEPAYLTDIKKFVNIGDEYYYLEFDEYWTNEYDNSDLTELVFSEYPEQVKLYYEYDWSGCAIIKKNSTIDGSKYSLVYKNYEVKMLPSVEAKAIVNKAKPFYKHSLEPTYSYQKVTKSIPENDFETIRKLVESNFGGVITEIYKLSEDLYYVVIRISDSKYVGSKLSLSNSGNGISYTVEQSTKEIFTQEELDAYVNEINMKPNITIDYSETAKFDKESDFTTYLKSALSEKGSLVNDSGKSEIAIFIENAITRLSTEIVNQKDNRIVVQGDSIEKAVLSANGAKSSFEKSLEGENIILNKDLTIIIRIDGSNLDMKEPLQVAFDKSAVDKIGNADMVLVLLGDNKHIIKISTVNLKTIISEYGGINIQVDDTGEGVYSITFADEKGSTIDKLVSPIGFLFPTQNELATVFASYKGGSDNWGGQYDPINQTIEISTKYSGKYEVLGNEILITDISELSDDFKKAIQFMVSKGYFKLSGDQFNFDGKLSRYDFTEALVRMFFALDRDVTTKFNDVKPENPYFAFVASAEKDRIVEGYSDDSFKGELNISKEQVIALCARTLAEKKGYRYPENTDTYLLFEDAEQIPDWAKQEIALAVREGLIDGTGTLDPKGDINRAEGAKILYKLFMLLYEPVPFEFVMSSSEVAVEPVSVEVAESSSDKDSNLAFPVGIAVLVLASIGGAVYFRRKK